MPNEVAHSSSGRVSRRKTVLDFRWEARQSLARAKSELATSADQRLRYAALELRFALEALTYDRALAYRDYIAPEDFEVWQPRRVMDIILDIDPRAGSPVTIAIGLEHEYGKPPPPEEMQSLGTDVPLSLKNIRDHYNALGSYLHMPSLAHALEDKSVDLVKLRSRCNEIAGLVEKILSSPIWNSTLGPVAVLKECSNQECKQPIKRRLPDGKTSMDTNCFACKAEYSVTWGDDHIVEWQPKTTLAKCATKGCSGSIPLWPHEVKAGTGWRCEDCGRVNRIVLGLTQEASDPDNNPPPSAGG